MVLSLMKTWKERIKLIKFEHTVTPSPEQMEFIIEGMRNPLDSWKKSDSILLTKCSGFDDLPKCPFEGFQIGENDANLMERLKNAGPEHRKFMRMMPVMVRITAPLYWWKEFDTYKIGTVRNSCSTMHTLHKKGVTPEAFSHEWVDECQWLEFKDNNIKHAWSIGAIYDVYLQGIEALRMAFNETHEKKYWYAMVQMLPDGFMMTANVLMNYEVIFSQIHQRAHHKQEEWSGQDGYLAWAKTLPYQFLLED